MAAAAARFLCLSLRTCGLRLTCVTGLGPADRLHDLTVTQDLDREMLCRLLQRVADRRGASRAYRVRWFIEVRGGTGGRRACLAQRCKVVEHIEPAAMGCDGD